MDHFEVGPVASPEFVGQRLALTVTARDDIENAVGAFKGPAQLIGVRGNGTRSRVLVTEIDVGPNDQVEFANVSNADTHTPTYKRPPSRLITSH